MNAHFHQFTHPLWTINSDYPLADQIPSDDYSEWSAECERRIDQALTQQEDFS